MEQTVNLITLRGALSSLPVFSHENHGRRFWRFTLEVPRLSGTVDLLPVIADELTVLQLDPFAGQMIAVTGQVRSHNVRSDTGRHLLIFVFATAVFVEEGEPLNQVILEGAVCKEPTYRRTPLGRQICDVMLAVPRAFHRADYLPCILWGRTARQIADCSVGQYLQLSGRLQSRVYTKLTETGTEERTAYEISGLTAQVLE